MAGREQQEPRHPLVELLRRFAVDWLDRADPDACAEIMDPGYTVHIGGHVLAGRDDAYVPATLGQLAQFPGLLLTVHDVVTSGEQAALRFTEHGPSARHAGTPAAWTGIALFWWNGQRLTRNATEEDYFARRRQLSSGTCDPIAAPAPAPWATAPQPPDPAAEQAVRQWLARGDLGNEGSVTLDDARAGVAAPPLVDARAVEVAELFSAGAHVAFHAVARGRYLGGLDGAPEPIDRDIELSCAGLVTVTDGGAITGHAVRDRAGLRRRLQEAP